MEVDYSEANKWRRWSVFWYLVSTLVSVLGLMTFPAMLIANVITLPMGFICDAIADQCKRDKQAEALKKMGWK